MSKSVLYMLACGAVVVAMLWMATPSALAVKGFKVQFEAKYVKEKPANDKEKAFAEAVAKAKCNVCHEGKKKKDRNVYGVELAKLLDKKADKDNVEKIQKALDKVAKLKSNEKEEKSPKFGDLIAAGKLPGGEPKKAGEKKEEK
jgi:cytochrome c553